LIKKSFFGILSIIVITILWITEEYNSTPFVFDVPQIMKVEFFESQFLYYYIHLFTFLPVFLLSFDKKVHFYKAWKYLFPAIGIVASLFIFWDIYFTQHHIWGFNSDYYIGPLIFNLPLEEILFFVNVPFACLFIYECLNAYIEKDILASFDKSISLSLAGVLLVVGILSWGKMYTSTTFILTGLFLLWHLYSLANTYRTRFYLAYLVSWFPFLLVDGVLTGGFTNAPIVLYSPSEFLNLRIGSVPIEDAVYSLLMLMTITTIFEQFRSNVLSGQ